MNYLKDSLTEYYLDLLKMIKNVEQFAKDHGIELLESEHHLNQVKCKECEYLEITGCYGECSKAYKGIVNPNDSCGRGKLKENSDAWGNI